jgi:hypothetical protein
MAAARRGTVNHNSKEYTDADEAMEKLEKAIREANDFRAQKSATSARLKCRPLGAS